MSDEFDPTRIDLLVEDIGESTAHDILRVFFEDSTDKLALLRATNAPCTRDVVERHAHSLKSAAAAFGFVEVAARAKSLEAEARTLSAGDIAAQVSGLSEALTRALGFARLP